MLASLGEMEGAAAVDLFAGSGALGIEALSRGAASVVFVERDPSALRAVADNLAKAGMALLPAGRARVVADDSLRYASSAPRADVVFVDPPYSFTDWPMLLERVASWADLAVIETGGPLDTGPLWEVVRAKTYGATLVTLARSSCVGDEMERREGEAMARPGRLRIAN